VRVGRKPAGRRHPARRVPGRGAAGGARLRDPRRRRAHGAGGPAPPPPAHAGSRARALPAGRRDRRGAGVGAGAAMTPTPRAAALLAAIALLALVLPPGVCALAALALSGATVVDALSVRRAPGLPRDLPPILSRGVPAPLAIAAPRRVRVRQAPTPDLHIAPSVA